MIINLRAGSIQKTKREASMIKFFEEGHQYVSLDGREFLSVTSLIKRYEERKDWDEIARKYAKKNKLSIEAVKLKWKQENDKAIERGLRFHRQREEELSGCENINGLEIFRPQFVEGIKVSQDQRLVPGMYPELLVYLNSARICGQADIVKVHPDGSFDIQDFKTNKEIKINAFINWEGVEERFLHPLGNIPHSNYWNYALQLNTYAYIIRKNNPSLKLGKLELLHIQFDSTDEEVSEIHPYVLPDLQSSVRSMIEHFKQVKI